MKRGIRLNNPGCIRHSANKWQGMSNDQPDDAFVKFATMQHGLRAMWRIMDSYYHNHGIRTLEGIVFRWAPPQDGNDTVAYIGSVCERVMWSSTAEIGWRPSYYFTMFWAQVIRAICEIESGYRPSYKELQDSHQLAFN